MLAGLRFEKKVDFRKVFAGITEYNVKKASLKAGIFVFYKGSIVARCFGKNDFYTFLEESKIDWKQVISKKISSHDALFVIVGEALFIIEDKFRNGTESVYKKLQTCDFKRKQYVKLVSPLGLKVEYVYILNDWFKMPRYKDVLDYINSVNCHYKFNELPLSWLGLPTS